MQWNSVANGYLQRFCEYSCVCRLNEDSLTGFANVIYKNKWNKSLLTLSLSLSFHSLTRDKINAKLFGEGVSINTLCNFKALKENSAPHRVLLVYRFGIKVFHFRTAALSLT